MDLIDRLREYASTRKGELAELITEAADALERQPCDDDPRADVYYLAEKIGIHRLYALVVALRGEPELCEDTISRQAAIERATKDHDFFKGATIPTDKARRDELLNVMCWLRELPSAQPERWILCSERLPEVGTYVLVSKKSLGFRSNLPNVCTAHRSCDPRSGKEEWNDMLFGKLDDDDVLAWMLLPEPYAERRTE